MIFIKIDYLLGHNFVIFDNNHADTSMYWNIRKFSQSLQRRYLEMILSFWRHQKSIAKGNITLQVHC